MLKFLYDDLVLRAFCCYIVLSYYKVPTAPTISSSSPWSRKLFSFQERSRENHRNPVHLGGLPTPKWSTSPLLQRRSTSGSRDCAGGFRCRQPAESPMSRNIIRTKFKKGKKLAPTGQGLPYLEFGEFRFPSAISFWNWISRNIFWGWQNRKGFLRSHYMQDL
jgi:hypothetical protein